MEKDEVVKLAQIEISLKYLTEQQANFIETMQETIKTLEERLTINQTNYKLETDKRLDAMDKAISKINNEKLSRYNGITNKILEYLVIGILAYFLFMVTGVKF